MELEVVVFMREVLERKKKEKKNKDGQWKWYSDRLTLRTDRNKEGKFLTKPWC